MMRRMHRISRVLPLLLTLSLTPALAGPPPKPDGGGNGGGRAGAYQTKNVILVGIDGLRLQESYKFAEHPDPLHPAADHTPRISSELLPQGTLYRNARCGAFNTITTNGVNTFVTGSWGIGPNRGRGLTATNENYVDNRPFEPTLFEHLRKDLGLPGSKVIGITDKTNSRISNYSYDPSYGAAWGPDWTYLVDVFNPVEEHGSETYIDPAYNSDLWVYQLGLDALDTQEPTFLFLYFGLVDLAGHKASPNDNFGFYTDSIENVDNLVADLWNEIQSRPRYAGRTTLIVTGDHGRHDDHSQLSYTSHEGTCLGCRDLLLFVIGPDTPAGQVVDRRAWQTDVAPTVAELLGFSMPYASGEPLHEALGGTAQGLGRDLLQNTSVVFDGQELLAVERNVLDGETRIALATAPEDGDFGPLQVLASDPGNSGFLADFPSILADQNGIHVVFWEWTEGNHKYPYSRSTDGGTTFQPGPSLAKGKPEDSSKGHITLDRPLLFDGGGGHERLFFPVVAFSGPHLGSLIAQFDYGTQGYGGASSKAIEDWVPDPRREGYHRWVDLSEGSTGDVYSAYSALRLPSDPGTVPLRSTWDLFFKNLTATSSDPSKAIRLSDNNAVPVVHPALAVDAGTGDTVYLAYARPPGDGEAFQVFVIQSLDEPKTIWSEPLEITQSVLGAWEPDLVVAGSPPTLHVVYTDHDFGQGDIVYRTVDPSQGWSVSAPTNLSASPGVSRNPAIVAGSPGKLHVVWEERDPAASAFSLSKATILLP